MKTLKNIQQDFQDFLRFGKEHAILENVVDGKPMTAHRRLRVYFEGYRLRLIEALQIDYPKVEILLGEEEFEQACLAYIDAYPSHNFSLRPFGRNFEQFLKETYPKHPYLAEMANFEWSLMASLDAKNAPVITLEALKAFPPEQWGYLVFSWHPSVHHRQYEWDTPSLWKDIEHEKPQRTPVHLESPCPWIFWRQGLKSKYESMDSIQNQIHHLITQLATFADMAETLCEHMEPEQVPQRLLQQLQYWIEQGLISSVKQNHSS